MNIQKLIEGLGQGRQFYEREEIKTAKRRISMKKLMRHTKDQRFITENPGPSPFPDCDKESFYLFKRRNRYHYFCSRRSDRMSSWRNDQITYLEQRYRLSNGDAIRLFCRMAGIK